MSTPTTQDPHPLFDVEKTQLVADDIIDKASTITHRAAEATVDRIVRPAVNVTRDAAIALEARANNTNRFLTDSLRGVEDEVHRNPVKALGYAAGFGFILGLWWRWK